MIVESDPQITNNYFSVLKGRQESSNQSGKLVRQTQISQLALPQFRTQTCDLTGGELWDSKCTSIDTCDVKNKLCPSAFFENGNKHQTLKVHNGPIQFLIFWKQYFILKIINTNLEDVQQLDVVVVRAERTHQILTDLENKRKLEHANWCRFITILNVGADQLQHFKKF